MAMLEKDKGNRFIMTANEKIADAGTMRILVDTETGLQYLFMTYRGGEAGGLTLLRDKDGRPAIDERFMSTK